MALSRTARILIAVLLVAAAAFFWVNFFNQDLAAPATTTADVPVPGAGVLANGAAGVATPSTVPSDAGAAGAPAATDAVTDASTPAVGDAATEGIAVAPDTAAPGSDASDGVATSSAPVVAQPADQAAGVEAPVVVAETPSVVTRDLVVTDLPFLVTQPPAPDAQATAQDVEAGATRPQAAVRSSVNPFSPIVVQAPAAARPTVAEATPVPESQPVITEVTSSGVEPQPTQATSSSTPANPVVATAPAEPVRAPAPRTTAPAPAAAASLPRPLPSGTLPVTPEILREARTQPTVPAGPADLGEVVAVRLPGNEPSAALPTVSGDGEEPQAAATPDVLGPGRATEPTAKDPPTLPLVVGVDQLSRYLRDNDVRFTGTVLGPLSVGVFRSSIYSQPVVLTLGQTLPETDILLADLRGYEAKFSLGNSTQTLSLDLRR